MFDKFPRFITTSKTTKDPAKLALRHKGLIEANRDIIKGASILDLASHDGRWSFAALQEGAEHVYGIEWQQELIDSALENMRCYGVPEDRYTFVCGDIFTEIPKVNRKIDCVFVFGIFYHIASHMLLLNLLSRLEPKHIIIDSNTSRLAEPAIRLQSEPGGNMVGHPSKSGIYAMLQYFGWKDCREIDWMPMLGDLDYRQYRSGKRVTVIGSRT